MDWARKHLNVRFVDVITEPGDDKVLFNGSEMQKGAIKDKVLVSVRAHNSKAVIVAGHHDCAGNPVSREEHWKEICACVRDIRLWNLPVRVIGLWVNERWEIEVVDDPNHGAEMAIPEVSLDQAHPAH